MNNCEAQCMMLYLSTLMGKHITFTSSPVAVVVVLVVVVVAVAIVVAVVSSPSHSAESIPLNMG